MHERQKAYRKRRAEKYERMEGVLKDIREALRRNEKDWAVQMRAKITEALGDD